MVKPTFFEVHKYIVYGIRVPTGSDSEYSALYKL